jgi:hypothetical protein
MGRAKIKEEHCREEYLELTTQVDLKLGCSRQT